MNNNRYKVIVGANVTKLRKDKGWTTQELGYACGIDRSALIHIEKGRINVTIKTLARISDALEVDMKVMFND